MSDFFIDETSQQLNLTFLSTKNCKYHQKHTTKILPTRSCQFNQGTVYITTTNIVYVRSDSRLINACNLYNY